MKKTKNDCDYESCFFCIRCRPEWIPAIAPHKKTFRLKKGATLFKEGEEVREMFFVFQGALKVHKQWGEKELIIRFAQKGDIVGHRGLGKDTHYPVSATALEPTIICAVTLDFFKVSLQVNQELLYELMLFFAQELQESEKKMRNLAHMPVKGRLAHALLFLNDRFGVDGAGFIDMELSRQDLASFAGAAYESVFRTLGELLEANIINIEDKKIGIVAKERLEAFMRV
jgi:CRP-like cAMP-binding protein